MAEVQAHPEEPIHGLVSDRYCLFEVILPRIQTMRVLLVNNLIIEEAQYSDTARRQKDFNAKRWADLERKISGMALANIAGNVQRLVQRPIVHTVHLADLNDTTVAAFDPDAIVLSGTLRDFDFYHPELLAGFQQFIRHTHVPVLGICGGHQLVGQAFGAEITTIDGKPPATRRQGRLIEYQYRFVKITDIHDPIFAGIEDRPHKSSAHLWQKYTERRQLLRVWQNHGLEIDRLPTGFKHLARGYLSEYQMIVKRTAEQLIYAVQFHLEKSFQDWQADNYWEHRNESRDGRLLFGNFLIEALKYRGKGEQLVKGKLEPLPVGTKAKTATAAGGGSSVPATGF
ncbi:MAG: gamma-glutamyl-gamma-aminobutyrate hydrolase family protein [Acidobacteria bacterium]|nr:gamma-glutamyl-gamma-aminobutyrate hydrolase family protein [Acidobacteriota bacterium]MBI3428200.1 gamma-glutamyl-gamma-aminobutyrate hydrolase family protein [Acidobacteriota bacterium]